MYVLYGEDTFRSRTRAREIVDKFVQVAGGTEAVTRLYAPDYTLADVRPLVETGSLFRDKRLVVLEEVSAAAKDVAVFFEEKASALQTAEDIFLFWDRGLEDAHPLPALIKNATKAQEFKRLAGTALSRWIDAEVESRNIKASPAEKKNLAARTAGDTWRIHHELEKMYTDRSSEAVAPSVSSPTVFQLTDAIGLRQRTQALAFFHALLSGGEAPEKIFSTISWHMRSLASIKELSDQGTDQAAMARATKLHPFVIKKASVQASNFSRQEISRLYEQLSELDTETKQNRRDLTIGLERILLSL